MNHCYAEDLEWARLRVLVAKERAARAAQHRPRDLHDAKTELHRANACLRARAAEALRANADPLFWHDRFGRPRTLSERGYQLSA